METTENTRIEIKLTEQEIKNAIVDWVKIKRPDLKDIKPKVSIYPDGELNIDCAKLLFEKTQ